MRLNTWKVLLSLLMGAITSIIGVSVWALETNHLSLIKIGLFLLFSICVIGSGWVISTLASVFKTIEQTLQSVDEIKEGLLEAQQLLKEHEEAMCICNIPIEESDQIEEFLSDKIN